MFETNNPTSRLTLLYVETRVLHQLTKAAPVVGKRDDAKRVSHSPMYSSTSVQFYRVFKMSPTRFCLIGS